MFTTVYGSGYNYLTHLPLLVPLLPPWFLGNIWSQPASEELPAFSRSPKNRKVCFGFI